MYPSTLSLMYKIKKFHDITKTLKNQKFIIGLSHLATENEYLSNYIKEIYT